jgi:hypothetical protein
MPTQAAPAVEPWESFLEQAKPAAQVGVCGPQPRLGEHLGEQ